MISIYVVIKDGTNQYYLLKVIRKKFDVYCIPPHLGVHFTLHESGESHFRYEEKAAKSGDELPVALVMGEAGEPMGNGIIRTPLHELGGASCICTAVFLIASLSQDFPKFNGNTEECFVIDAELLPNGTSGVEIGIWAVPSGDQISFEFNVPNIPASLLYKVAQCEPQIWIYARPC